MDLCTDPDLKRHGIIHHCPDTGVYVRADEGGKTWTVFRPTASRVVCYSDSTYTDLSLAVARCNYLAKRAKAGS